MKYWTAKWVNGSLLIAYMIEWGGWGLSAA